MVFPLAKPVVTERKGTVLRIEKTSIHDGKGLRTVVFLKGCPLHCQWCSTPESQKTHIQRGYDPRLCQSCGRCVDVCPENALSFTKTGRVTTDSGLCSGCLVCAAQCTSNAVKGYGKEMTVSQVVAEVCKDEVFFFHSGGGVTLSGGECLQQPKFVEEILRGCRMQGIDTAIETSLFGKWADIESILPLLNAIYVDVKHGDAAQHKKYVGVDNNLILENLQKLNESRFTFSLHLRIPLIPGINDSDESLLQILRIAEKFHRVSEIEVLPYHRLGVRTYSLLNTKYLLESLSVPDRNEIKERIEFLRAKSKRITISAGSGLA